MNRWLNSALSRTLVVAAVFGAAVVGAAAAGSSAAAELETLTPETWEEYAPQGKEVDCIYGDYVLRNDLITAVIAQPVATRNANMTVRNVGGAVIDLTSRDRPNDQLSAFYPGAAEFPLKLLGCGANGEPTLSGEAAAEPAAHCAARGQTVYLEVHAPAEEGRPAVKTRYELSDGSPWLVVRTTYFNSHTQPLEVTLQDSLRADRGFELGEDDPLNLFWAYDPWWNQAYGVVADEARIMVSGGARPLLQYAHAGNAKIALAPQSSHTLVRRLIPARNLLEVKAAARQLAEHQDHPLRVRVEDAQGPVEGAFVTLARGESRYGWGRTDASGLLETSLPAGEYTATVTSPVHPEASRAIDVKEGSRPVEPFVLAEPGYVVANLRDGEGEAIACKVEFVGLSGTESPDFGPDTGIYGVKNLRYTPNGEFRQPIRAGNYLVRISHGPEYDALVEEIEVREGEVTNLRGALNRSVDTTGWVSSDFHSHSSPSGDNTSSQRGRVLNLLAEHLEFAPCTEHNRISTYVPDLEYFGAVDRMATCTGMELTGSPLPVNHQNAFPLVHQPRTQDGGGPVTDPDPIVQVERLAMWDNASDKLVQGNHPNLLQVLADRDLDGQGDGGFEPMIGFMDVIEVHPPGEIFNPPSSLEPSARDRGNTIFHWLQMLNLGYRVPGVVNTDAHYNFHGSGWLRNYIRSETDDPAEIDCMDMVHAAEHGELVMTNGPFMEVYLQAERPGRNSASGVGGNVSAPGGKADLSVKIQCPNWFDINRVQVFVNGRPVEHLNFTRRANPDRFSDETVKFDSVIPLELDADAHVIVATIGEGLKLGPVMGPAGETAPVAVSNPIFVDVDGNGFKANGDLLGLPLPLPSDFKPSHGHHHSHSHGDHSHEHPH
ncbi:CehA/McbA family metallohydrolase [Candidatus Laterigemmans baculatus]|uniref:CehA/McbA family metallohydrolase n=1 Tax=Candidatus Laterigemmans baculatus TaxID=2770505 RepID=UPI00193B2A91|nr:CehA/McbA family metallohydrolase [Candidatus Laterigemmans baculatus]